jgi:hypothetical protein
LAALKKVERVFSKTIRAAFATDAARKMNFALPWSAD